MLVSVATDAAVLELCASCGCVRWCQPASISEEHRRSITIRAALLAREGGYWGAVACGSFHVRQERLYRCLDATNNVLTGVAGVLVLPNIQKYAKQDRRGGGMKRT